MTDITELAQMKGQKVEGSYYLAECTDCGKMYPSNKLNGGEPLFSGDYGECYCPHCNADDAAIGDCGDTAAIAWNYQQGRIDALVEALEKAQQSVELVDLQRDKIKRLESDLWDKEQLRKVHSEKSFELEGKDRELEARNQKDFVWRGEEIGRLNDEVDELKEKLESHTVTIEPFRSFVTDADLAALHRFAECCDDPESGGHDLEKEQVRRLEAIGALRRFGCIHWITGFGDVLISITAGIKWEAE
ncbi:TPA: hypothetical protein ACK2W2_004007 [Klebsiella michiganensis]